MSMKACAQKSAVIVCGAAAAMMVVGAVTLFDSRSANAKPEFAAQTGKPCGQCHQNPGGGGALKPYGQKFKDNGFKLK
ncbi:MAG: hypothetical protein WDN48_19320 [Pseudolabrys sp.]